MKLDLWPSLVILNLVLIVCGTWIWVTDMKIQSSRPRRMKVTFSDNGSTMKAEADTVEGVEELMAMAKKIVGKS